MFFPATRALFIVLLGSVVFSDAGHSTALNKKQREDPNIRLTDDAVIIEVSGAVRHRREIDRKDHSRQFLFRQGFGGLRTDTFLVTNPLLGAYPILGASPALGPNNVLKASNTPTQTNKGSRASLPHAPCITASGQLGKCASFRECYPYFKVPNLASWGPWIFGSYDTCNYYSDQIKQTDVFQTLGVCCVSPVVLEGQDGSTPSSPPVIAAVEPQDSPNTAPVIASVDLSDIPGTPVVAPVDASGGGLDESDSRLQPVGARPALGVWPPPLPPLPTHPPDHAAPTHPPALGVPAATKPTQTTTTKKPFTTTWGTKPPAQTTLKPQPWPPAIPTHTPLAPMTTIATDVSGACGAKNGYQDQERIVGGHSAEPNEWPWIVALFNAGRQFCGGSLIDNQHVLSAAHCVAHMTSSDVARVTARLGDHDIKSNHEVRHVEKRVRRVVRHRGFDMRTLYNDIAILTLDTPVQFTREIRPVCLPRGGESFAGSTGTVVGWGSLREGGVQPGELQEVSIPIWTNGECRSKYGAAAPGGIVEHMLCAGRATKDSCSGDSGGPLSVGSGGRWTQVGVVSWGIGCGKGQYPGVYSRVTSFLPWIQKNTKQ